MANPHRRLPHDAWEITCEVCGLASSDAPSAAAAILTALEEGYREVKPGKWICDVRDDAHVAALP